MASKGLFNTKVEGLHIVDSIGKHLLLGVTGAMYESIDGAESWTYINGSNSLGTCNQFRNGARPASTLCLYRSRCETCVPVRRDRRLILHS